MQEFMFSFLFFFSACIQPNSFLEGFYKPSTHHELPKTSLAQISAVQYHWFPYLFRVAGTRLKFSALFVYSGTPLNGHP